MIGYELDLKSPDFQTLFPTNAARVAAGKGHPESKKTLPDVMRQNYSPKSSQWPKLVEARQSVPASRYQTFSTSITLTTSTQPVCRIRCLQIAF